MVSQLFDILFDGVQTITFVSPTEMKNMAIKWKKHYVLLRDFVADINSIFGKTLLIFMNIKYVQLVTHVYVFFPLLIPGYKSTESITSHYNLFHIFFFVKLLAYFTAVIIVSEQLPQKVSITFVFSKKIRCD